MNEPVPTSSEPRTQTRSTSGWERFYAVVRRIPRGRVASYGQIAREARVPRQARQVGYALAALAPGTDVPWQRVINARGRLSPRRDAERDSLQRQLLLTEGVVFDASGRIDLDRFGWRPSQHR